MWVRRRITKGEASHADPWFAEVASHATKTSENKIVKKRRLALLKKIEHYGSAKINYVN